MFTQKHYEFFARFYGKAIKRALGDKLLTTPSILWCSVESIIMEFRLDSSKFKEELFRKRLEQFISGER